jgi:tetratricopeptide (TPR) repeat protein
MGNDSGDRIRALRTARGIAQADLAATVGVSKSYLSHIEAGRRPITPALLSKLAEALDVEIVQLESGTPADLHEEIRLKLAFAELSLRNGEWDLAAQEFAAIQDQARALPLSRFLDEATWGLARSLEATGRVEDAIILFEGLLAQPQLSASVPRATVSVRLIMGYSECGDLGRAIDIGERALDLMAHADPADDVSAQVELISTVAGCYLERGDLTRAHILIDRALERAGDDGAPRARAAAAWNAAIISYSRHDHVAARGHADRALALYAEMDATRAVGLLRVVSAGLRLNQREPDVEAALPDLSRALEDLAEVGTRLDLAYVRTEQARAYLQSGDVERAGEAAELALQDLSTGDRLETGRTLVVLGHVAAAQGQPDEAVARYREAATALEAAGAPRQAGTAWRELGEAYIELGRSDDAIEALRRASDLAGATYNPLRSGSVTATGPVGR